MFGRLFATETVKEAYSPVAESMVLRQLERTIGFTIFCTTWRTFWDMLFFFTGLEEVYKDIIIVHSELCVLTKYMFRYVITAVEIAR